MDPSNIIPQTPEDQDVPDAKNSSLELLEKFENMYQKLGGKMTVENPLESIEHEDMNTLWKKLGNNRMLGILHAFVLLRPVIKEALEHEQEQDGDEGKMLADVGMKVDYLESLVGGVLKKVNGN